MSFGTLRSLELASHTGIDFPRVELCWDGEKLIGAVDQVMDCELLELGYVAALTYETDRFSRPRDQARRAAQLYRHEFLAKKPFAYLRKFGPRHALLSIEGDGYTVLRNRFGGLGEIVDRPMSSAAAAATGAVAVKPN